MGRSFHFLSRSLIFPAAADSLFIAPSFRNLTSLPLQMQLNRIPADVQDTLLRPFDLQNEGVMIK